MFDIITVDFDNNCCSEAVSKFLDLACVKDETNYIFSSTEDDIDYLSHTFFDQNILYLFNDEKEYNMAYEEDEIEILDLLMSVDNEITDSFKREFVTFNLNEIFGSFGLSMKERMNIILVEAELHLTENEKRKLIKDYLKNANFYLTDDMNIEFHI